MRYVTRKFIAAIIVLMPGLAAAAPIAGEAGMTASQFSAWVVGRRQEMEKQNAAPAALEQPLIERLRADRWVPDATVIQVVNAWSFYESRRGGTSGGAVLPHFPRTHRIINELLPLLAGRGELQAQLYEKSGSLYRMERASAAAARDYQKALDLLTPIHLEIDRQRLESLVEQAAALTRTGDVRGAETLYLKALQYPFYLASVPEMEQALSDLYIRAGRGIIDLRRHNLPALKELVFVPATEGELGPYLQAAIKEAGGP